MKVSLKEHGLSQQDLDMEAPWQALQVFNIYRLLLSLVLILFYFFHIGSLNLGQRNQILYLCVIFAYTILCIISIYVTQRRLLNYTVQIVTEVIIDIIVLTLLMYTSVGAAYAIGIMINVAIASGSIIIAGRLSLMFAAFATILLLLGHAFTQGSNWGGLADFRVTGTLGLTFFATAILSYGLSKRIRISEAIANQHRVDLAKLERLNELIIQRMHSGVIVVDEFDRIRFANEAAWYLLGLPMSTGRAFLGDVSPNLMEQMRIWSTSRRKNEQSLQANLKGQAVLVQFTALGQADLSPTLIFLEDTARMAQQAQQMKLASLGRLTASIAHEIRNPLGAISHAAQLLGESTRLSEDDGRMLEIINEQSKRMNDVIENILQLSRRKQAVPIVLEAQPWLQEFIENFKIKDTLKPEITLHVDDENIEIFADITQLHQVLTNLCENGLQYSHANTGRYVLTINLGLTPDKKQPFIEVIDRGEGIDAEQAEYIFEPFFTTKQGGTGLGLYIARELCEVNQARLNYYPAEAGGSCFRIVFTHSME